MNKKIKRIDEHITEYLSLTDKEDTSELDSTTPTPEEIKAVLRELTERMGKVSGIS